MSEETEPGAGLVGAACAAAQPVVPVPVLSNNNTSAMQFFAPDPSDRDSVSDICMLNICCT